MIPGSLQQDNGNLGEARTQSALLRRFWVLKRSVDVEGADFLVQLRADSIEELRERHTEAFGVVQAKYFEARNQVRILRTYVEDEEEPRSNFYVLIHTDTSDGEPISYFFSAAQIVSFLKLSRCNKYYVFRLTNKRDYSQFRNVPEQKLLAEIAEGICQSRADKERAVLESFFRTDDASRETRSDAYVYMLRNVEGVNVVLVRRESTKDSVVKLLEPRRDIYPYSGNFAWGYIGSGPSFLCASILGHHFADGRPTTAEREALLRNIVCKFTQAPGSENMFSITTKMIESALQGVSKNQINYVGQFREEFGELGRPSLIKKMAQLVDQKVTNVLSRPDFIAAYKNPQEEVVRFKLESQTEPALGCVTISDESVRKFIEASATYSGAPLNYASPVLSVRLPENVFCGHWLEASGPPVTIGFGFCITKNASG